MVKDPTWLQGKLPMVGSLGSQARGNDPTHPSGHKLIKNTLWYYYIRIENIFINALIYQRTYYSNEWLYPAELILQQYIARHPPRQRCKQTVNCTSLFTTVPLTTIKEVMLSWQISCRCYFPKWHRRRQRNSLNYSIGGYTLIQIYVWRSGNSLNVCFRQKMKNAKSTIETLVFDTMICWRWKWKWFYRNQRHILIIWYKPQV